MEWDISVINSYVNISLIVGVLIQLLVCRKKLGQHIGYFIISMGCVVAAGILSIILSAFFGMENSTMLYMVFVNLLTFFFIFLYYLQLLKSSKLILYQKSLIIVFLVSYGLCAVFISNFFEVFPVYFYSFQMLLLLVGITIFFFETFNTDHVLNIKDYFPFWLSLGLIVIYVGLMPILLFINNVNISLSREVYYSILLAINIIGYGLLAYGISRSKATSNQN